MITPFNRLQILFACLLFIFPTLLFSQDESIQIRRGRLYTTEGFEIKFAKLMQYDAKFAVKDFDGKVTVYDKNDILRIEQRKGSEALAWTGYIGTIALLESWLLVQLNNNLNSLRPANPREQNRIVIISSTTIGALVGFLIGSTKIRYKKIYDDPDLGFSAPKFGLNFSAPNNVSSLTLTYHF